MIRATVHVDLATKSCTIVSGDTQHGQWSGITRSTVLDAISRDGWVFAPDTVWTLTPDGGTRDVLLHPAIASDDRLLDGLGSAVPQQRDGSVEDELCVLLLAWRRDIDTEPVATAVLERAA